MKKSMIGLTMVGFLIAGCGDDSMPENNTERTVTSETLSSVRIHIGGFKKSKSGAT